MAEKENSNNNKRRHRALILQGGAALGAYEAGAYRALYNWLRKDSNTTSSESEDENVFDIIAGTSIGAINAAIIVSYVKQNRTWKYSADRLWEFWKAMRSISIVETIPGYTIWWDYLHNTMKLSRYWWDDILSLLYRQTDSYPYAQEWMKRFKDYVDYFLNDYFDIAASGEAARRYYSVRQFLITGANNVFQPLAFGIHDFFSPIALAKPDYKFYDNMQNLWFRYGNLPLRRLLMLSQNYFIQPSIRTDSDLEEPVGDNNKSSLVKPKEPRLLLVTVDVATGETVTIDSYPYRKKECKICNKSCNNLIDHIEYDHKIPRKGIYDSSSSSSSASSSLRWSRYKGKENNTYVIIHDGITVDYILASASVPIHYDYQEICVWRFEDDYKKNIKQQNNKKSTSLECHKENIEYKDPKEEGEEEIKGHEELRKFWDGQFVSNTPLREVINEHQSYWKKAYDDDNTDGISIRDILLDESGKYKKVPDLDVYIVSLWPKEEEDIPKDHDGQIDRRNDISFYDKTEYDQKVAELLNDYIEMVKELASKVKREDFERIMKHRGTSKSRTHKKSRSYEDLLLGAIDVKVTRIERKDDPHAISQKWADYSFGSISRLYKEGIIDTMNKLLEKEIIEEIENLAYSNDNKNNNNNNKSSELDNNEKQKLINLANYISKIMAKEDSSKPDSYNFNKVLSRIKQKINETELIEKLFLGNGEKVLDTIDQAGAKYIEVFRVCLEYDDPYSPPHHSLLLSKPGQTDNNKSTNSQL